ncbi:MAG: methyl-coenzyme M reductase operon protein D [Methanomassiliicoccaceae archaeon]|jgi:methyl-coenzyme M reductase subunit D|nr:methyl-coenzyme M reductase operon protein D [Methanomassiliicoccaceae archaeon]
MTGAKTTKTTYAGTPLPEVKVFTERLLSAESTEKVLNALIILKHVRQINICGETLPLTVKSGPNTGIPVNHPERKVIKVGDNEIELTKLVGGFYVELNGDADVDATVEEIRKVCDKLIKTGYSLEVGRYSKYRPTLTDTLRC